jgi:hypothetical protein
MLTIRSMPRHVTVDALKRARFPLVEFRDECWSGKPQLNPTTRRIPTTRGLVARTLVAPLWKRWCVNG